MSFLKLCTSVESQKETTATYAIRLSEEQLNLEYDLDVALQASYDIDPTDTESVSTHLDEMKRLELATFKAVKAECDKSDDFSRYLVLRYGLALHSFGSRFFLDMLDDSRSDQDFISAFLHSNYVTDVENPTKGIREIALKVVEHPQITGDIICGYWLSKNPMIKYYRHYFDTYLKSSSHSSLDRYKLCRLILIGDDYVNTISTPGHLTRRRHTEESLQLVHEHYYSASLDIQAEYGINGTLPVSWVDAIVGFPSVREIYDTL